jgi:hypothetical protein
MSAWPGVNACEAHSASSAKHSSAFLAEEVMSLMRTIYEEAGDRVLLGDMVTVYNAALAGLGLDES